MQSSTIVVVHSELDEQRRIADTLNSLNHPIKYASDLGAIIAVYQLVRIALIVTPDIRIPFEKQHVVERIQRASLRIPVIVLVDEPGREKCPKATRLLMGVQHYVPWPDETGDLLPVARGMLRTARLLEEASTQPGDPDWIPALREVGAAQERRDLITAMRATNGNISRAADLLGISRGGLQYRLRKHGVQPNARARGGSGSPQMDASEDPMGLWDQTRSLGARTSDRP